MQVNNHDLKQVDDAVAKVRDNIFESIESALSYLDPHASTDPLNSVADVQPHLLRTVFDQEGLVDCAGHIAGVLDMLTELHAWTVRREAIVAVMDRYGPDATMLHVKDGLALALAQRVSNLDAPTGPLRSTDLYGLLLAQYLGRAVTNCEMLHRADPILTSLCEKVAPVFGQSAEQVKDRYRSGDEDVTKAVGKALLEETAANLKARGISIHSIPAGVVEGIGQDSIGFAEDVPEDVAQIAERLGIDPTSLRTLNGNVGTMGPAPHAMEPA